MGSSSSIYQAAFRRQLRPDYKCYGSPKGSRGEMGQSASRMDGRWGRSSNGNPFDGLEPGAERPWWLITVKFRRKCRRWAKGSILRLRVYVQCPEPKERVLTTYCDNGVVIEAWSAIRKKPIEPSRGRATRKRSGLLYALRTTEMVHRCWWGTPWLPGDAGIMGATDGVPMVRNNSHII